jgi:hypothetical protein
MTLYFFGLLCGLAFRNHVNANTSTDASIRALAISLKNPPTAFGIICPKTEMKMLAMIPIPKKNKSYLVGLGFIVS